MPPSLAVQNFVRGFLAGLDPAELDEATRLAEARHAIGERATLAPRPAWATLTDDERATATVEALYHLRAARGIGLLGCPRCRSTDVADLGGYLECRGCGHGYAR